MARTHQKWTRPYINGYSFCGYARSIGTLGLVYDTAPDFAFCDGAKNIVLGQASVQCGPISAFMAPSATVGFHETFSGGYGDRDVLIALGVNAEPVQGDPVFAACMAQNTYTLESGEGFAVVSVAMTETGQDNPNAARNPFGVLLHANAAETAVNTAVGVDDRGAATLYGGVLHWQLLSSDGTVALKAQHATANLNASFSDITGATSGDIDATTTPQSGQVAVTGTINRYIRWQLAFNSATTATFVLAFTRENH